jgi:hypothetical protein
MRAGKRHLNSLGCVTWAAIILSGVNVGRAADISVGSGVVIGAHGEVLTNAHVVKDCTKITVRGSSASIIARDEKNDLAAVRSDLPSSPVAIFRDGRPVRAGDAVVALGYPLFGLLTDTASLSAGHVSALAGIGGDTRFLQIDAAVQPGNSGGPLLDASGHLVGIVTGKLDVMRLAPVLRDIPQNVNFALRAEMVRAFLDSRDIAYKTAPSEQQLSPADVGEIGRPFTVHIACEQAAASQTLPGPEAQRTEAQPKYQVSRNLKLHERPDAKSANLLHPWTPDYIPQGTKFVGEPRCILEGAGAGWCKITYNHDGVTATGWVNGWLLEKLKFRASRNFNLHESPDAKSANLLSPWSPDYIPQGTEFGEASCLLEGAGAGWCKITFRHHNGVETVGWVNGWLLEKLP